MSEKNIHIVGDEEIVLMLGLLGIEGTIIRESDDFLKIFDNLVNNPTFDMIIVALDLPKDIIEMLVDFKLNKRRPFIFYLPNIFELGLEDKNILLRKIIESVGNILS